MEPNSKNLLGAILLFILLDLSVLVINFWITLQLSKDAVAINLSGRQRMLSQEMTKLLLQLEPPIDATVKNAAQRELRESARIFDQTLRAFKEGGVAVSGEGGAANLAPVSSVQAASLVAQATQIWQPMRQRLMPYMATQLEIPEAVLSAVRAQMLQDNRRILDLMNRLTSSLEQDSSARANTLRLVQTGVFMLALVNFFVIVRKFHLLTQQSAQTSRHYTELAMRDPLTGLFNRRQFEHTLQKELAVVDRDLSRNVALVMIDLDGFKAVNDQHGHDIGDVVLRSVASRLIDGARLNDTVARVGGDEFVLICPDLHAQENIHSFCQRLLDSLRRPIPCEDRDLHIDASIGVAIYPNDAQTASDLIRSADKAMYTVKKANEAER